MLPPLDINDMREKLSYQLRPFQRSFHFWVRAIDIYTGYKVSLSLSLSLSNLTNGISINNYSCFWIHLLNSQVFQVRVNFERDVQKREAMWERQHELAADKIYSMCTDLGGFFLKVLFCFP